MEHFMNENNNSNMDELNEVLAVLDRHADINGANDQQQQHQQHQQQYQQHQQHQQHHQQQQIMNVYPTGRIGVERARPIESPERKMPYTVIIEQPASKSLRFRYECEGRSAGSIPGVNSTSDIKTFPTIKVIGYVGRAVVVVSCVTKDSYDGKYRAHPHNLVGKEGCKKGVCTAEISPNNNMEVSFPNLGIQCVKKKDIEDALITRKNIRVDPFKAGFSHKNQPMDLNVVRLCFQVILPNEQGNFTNQLRPVVSDPIYDKKAMSDLVICRLSHCCASAAGGTSVILLCEKVVKDDIQVRFFEKKNNKIIWEKYAEFSTTDVHKQVAITFKTPKYDLKPSDKAVKVFVQLRRPSDKTVGEPRPFEIIPVGSDEPEYLKRKRTRYSNDQSTDNLRVLQNNNENIIEESQVMYENMIKPEPSEPLMVHQQWGQPGSYNNQWNQPGCSPWSQSGYSTSVGTGSPLGANSISPSHSPNSITNRKILSPRRTPSPMEKGQYNMSPQYHQQIDNSSFQPQFLHPNTGYNQQTSVNISPINIPDNQNTIFDIENQENANPSLGSLGNIDVDDLLINNLSDNTLASLSISADVNIPYN